DPVTGAGFDPRVVELVEDPRSPLRTVVDRLEIGAGERRQLLFVVTGPLDRIDDDRLLAEPLNRHMDRTPSVCVSSTINPSVKSSQRSMPRSGPFHCG